MKKSWTELLYSLESTIWKVVEEDGYVKVYRGKDVICAGLSKPGKRVVDIEFTDPKHQKNNKTRQKAMQTLQQAGWK